MNKLLQSGWVVALVGCLSYLGTTVAVLRVPRPAQAHAAVLESPAASGPSWRFHNAELDQLVQELRGEKEAQKVQRLKLEEWAARLQAERLELNSVTQVVFQMQQEFDQALIRLKEEEKENLKRLAKMYAGMSPEGAVKILQEMEDEPLVKILATMKDAETAAVLEALAREPGQAKRAALLTDRLRVLLSRTPPAAKGSKARQL